MHVGIFLRSLDLPTHQQKRPTAGPGKRPGSIRTPSRQKGRKPKKPTPVECCEKKQVTKMGRNPQTMENRSQQSIKPGRKLLPGWVGMCTSAQEERGETQPRFICHGSLAGQLPDKSNKTSGLHKRKCKQNIGGGGRDVDKTQRFTAKNTTSCRIQGKIKTRDQQKATMSTRVPDKAKKNERGVAPRCGQKKDPPTDQEMPVSKAAKCRGKHPPTVHRDSMIKRGKAKEPTVFDGKT